MIRGTPTRTGRNDLCPCGSGKKFKRCCARMGTITRPIYRSFQHCYSLRQRRMEGQFVRQWGITPTPSILAAYMDGDDERVSEWMGEKLTKAGCKPEFVAGILALQRLATPDNQSAWSASEKNSYSIELSRFCPPTPQEQTR